MKTDPALIARIRSLAETGHHANAIATDVDVPAPQVRSLAKHYGIKIRRMTVEERAASGRAAVSSVARFTTVPVPNWVPADLVEEYRDFARQFGAAYADHAIKRLIAEAGRGAA